MGVGAAKRPNAIKWTVVERMVWAWILTLPITGALAWLLVSGFDWSAGSAERFLREN
jgi:PiT family inorganic phosphate transporter